MVNPNNCETCDYKKMNVGQEGHCYMFKDEPTDRCHSHTGQKDLNRLIERFVAQQKQLDATFDAVLREHLWDLYEKESTDKP